jgi:predicted nucleic acid-binding protein
VNDFVLDASLALQWFLEDEANRAYSLTVLSRLSSTRAIVPLLWFYEVGNGLVMAQRRKRIRQKQVDEFLARLRQLPIDSTEQVSSEILTLPALAQKHQLTTYDAAYLALAEANHVPLATNDSALRRAAASVGVRIF